MRDNFEDVSIKATYTWTENGKRRQKTKTFCQTINPLNRDEHGQPKTRAQITEEILRQRQDWLDSMAGAIKPAAPRFECQNCGKRFAPWGEDQESEFCRVCAESIELNQHNSV